MISYSPAHRSDGAAIERLLDQCFGPARHARTAYKLREGAAPIGALSLVARVGDTVVGSVQLWPIALYAGTQTHALTLLGPLAVSRDRRCEGVGSALLTEALARADALDTGPIVLIGDEPYYGRFGFTAAGTQGWALPGPVDRARLLIRGGGALPAVARLGPVRRALPLAA